MKGSNFNHSRNVQDRTGQFFVLACSIHFIFLSFVGLKNYDISIPDKNAPIRLDEIKFLKKDAKSTQSMNLNARQVGKTSAAAKIAPLKSNQLDLSSLGINTGTVASLKANTVNGKILQDQVNEQKAQRALTNKTTEVTYLEKNEARELLNRHRRRLRTPEIQMDQEAKLSKLNGQLGNSIPAQISDFNFSIVPNKKFSEESLNDMEKKFYAFYLRLSDRYSNVISSKFQKSLVTRPQLKNSLRDSHVLQAKVVYDKQGNLVLTKILKSSNYPDVHATFEDILSDFGLPNVPEEILDEDSQYTVYFTLTIN